MATTPNPVKSFSQAAKDAGIPPYIKMEQLAALGRVTYLNAHGASRTAPDGTNSDGFVVTVEASDGRRYEAFIGAEILTRVIGQIELPFSAALTKEGRSWVFVD